MRYLASIEVIREAGEDEFASTHTSENLAKKVAEAGISHWYASLYLTCSFGFLHRIILTD
jgi:hypothetical protein